MNEKDKQVKTKNVYKFMLEDQIKSKEKLKQKEKLNKSFEREALDKKMVEDKKFLREKEQVKLKRNKEISQAVALQCQQDNQRKFMEKCDQIGLEI